GRRWLGWETALGGLLVLVGIGVGLGQALEVDLGGGGGPFGVRVPGLALRGVGLTAAGRLGEVLATLGGLVTMTGLVLGVQNATDRFDTWASPWPLGWVGVGVPGPGCLAPSGGWLIAAGLVGFGVLAVVFEVVVGIGGRPVGSAGRYGLGAPLIGGGLVLGGGGPRGGR